MALKRATTAFKRGLALTLLVVSLIALNGLLGPSEGLDENFYGNTPEQPSSRGIISPSFHTQSILLLPAPELMKTDEVIIHEKEGCKLSQFGRSPWQPTDKPRDAEWETRTLSALYKLHVEPEAARIAIEKFKRFDDSDWVWIGNEGILSSKENILFRASFDTTYSRWGQNYVCRNTTTNFKNPEYTEVARYVKIKGLSTTYHLMEPYACGNISRIYPEDGQGKLQGKPKGKLIKDPIAVPTPSAGVLLLLGLVLTYFWRKQCPWNTA